MKLLTTILTAIMILATSVQASSNSFTQQQQEIIQSELDDLDARMKEIQKIREQLSDAISKQGVKAVLSISGVLISTILSFIMVVDKKSYNIVSKKKLIGNLSGAILLASGLYELEVTNDEIEDLTIILDLKLEEYEEEYQALTVLKNSFHLQNLN